MLQHPITTVALAEQNQADLHHQASKRAWRAAIDQPAGLVAALPAAGGCSGSAQPMPDQHRQGGRPCE